MYHERDVLKYFVAVPSRAYSIRGFPSPSMPHYDTFRDQLAIAHPEFGHALWDTSPGEQYLPVEIGDVGFIRRGKFQRLFNALYPGDHPCNQRFGVPEDHEQLRLLKNHIDRGTLYPNNFCSYGVTTEYGGSNVHAIG